MHRTSLHRSLPVLLAAALCAGSLPATAQDLSGVKIEAQPVAGSVSMLVGRGGNIGVCAGDDGVFLIDDQFAPLTERIVAAVETISPEAIRFVVNTHHHADHTGGNENLGSAGAVIVAHDNVRKRMTGPQFEEALRRRGDAAKKGLPVVTFADAVTFHLNGEEIHVFHVDPAHTDGDSVVHFKKANVVHMGDLYFNGLYPFIDLSSGGSVDGVLAAVARVQKICDDETRIIPGHGPLSNRKELQTYAAMLKEVRDAVAKLIAAGKTRDEVVAAKPSAKFDEVWGGGFMPPPRFVGIVHDSLKR